MSSELARTQIEQMISREEDVNRALSADPEVQRLALDYEAAKVKFDEARAQFESAALALSAREAEVLTELFRKE